MGSAGQCLLTTLGGAVSKEGRDFHMSGRRTLSCGGIHCLIQAMARGVSTQV